MAHARLGCRAASKLMLSCTNHCWKAPMNIPRQELRRSARVTVMLSATIIHGRKPVAAKLLNISPDGAFISGLDLGQKCRVILGRSGLEVPCHVRWRKGENSGLSFERAVDVASMLRPITSPRPRANPRSGRPGLRSVRLSDADQSIVDSWLAHRARLPD